MKIVLSASDTTQLLTIEDFIRYGENLFDKADLYFGHGTDNAWDEAVALVLHCLKLPAHSGPEVLDTKLEDSQKALVEAIFQQRIEQRIPAPYLTGKSWFSGLCFHVDERVLIPRSPIAELIEQQFSPWLFDEPRQILDLCTGSGCIGLACAVAFPEAKVLLSDISAEALAVARKNTLEHALEDRVTLVESDLFSAIEQGFDLIVVNPPYVDADDLADMPEEYHSEPKLALASGFDGLDFTRRLLREASGHLSEKGCLCVEVGNSRRHLEAALPEMPFNWLEFERGGDGVFILYREDLLACADDLSQLP